MIQHIKYSSMVEKDGIRIRWRKRSMSTQSERFNPATFEPKIGVKTA